MPKESDKLINSIEVNFFKSLILYLPLMSLMAYIFGTFRLYLYYELFDFNIFPYLDFSDSLTQFFSDVILIAGFLLFILVFTRLMDFFSKKSIYDTTENDIVPKPTVEEETKTFNYLDFIEKYKSKKSHLVPYCLFALSYVLCTFELLDSDIFSKYDGIIQLTSLLFLIILFAIQPILKLNGSSKVKYKHLNLFIILSFFTFFVITLSVEIKVSVIKSIGTKGSSVVTKNEKIESNQDCLFVGVTSKYVFFYEVKSDEMQVVPITEVTKLIVSDK